MKGYETIESAPVSARYEVERSVFLAQAKGVASAEEAKEFVAEAKKKYFDATHNCYAYLCADGQKFSDDGEPGGTAGMPILEAVKAKNLENVVVVVTRYFGGIKLGAGGLTRAYAKAAGEALARARRKRYVPCYCVSAEFAYPLYGDLKRRIAEQAQIENESFENTAKVRFLAERDVWPTLRADLINAACGRIVLTEEGCDLYPLREKKGS